MVVEVAKIRSNSGCKVGWDTYDNEAEARKASEAAKVEAVAMAQQGYDFGYQSPGEIVQARKDGEKIPEWTVTVP